MQDGALAGALRTHFGLEEFRTLQREIIGEVMAGRSVVGILPTGGGKSLCYQLPAMLLPGVTLVISPLISLMKDQVDALVSKGIPAVAINSQDTATEGRRKLEALAAGEVRLAFVAPERLRSGAFLDACRRVEVSLLAVDEAHCVSQWGHDFRPDYRYIRDFRADLGSPPLLALTATAKPEVRKDVMEQLGITGVNLFAAGADRSNLWLGFEACATVAEKRAKVLYLAGQAGGSTIIYVSSRKDAETWATLLEERLGEPVAAYHAGLSAAERTAVQNRFMAGLVRVVVATNAFGMGIDKPDIRAVIHAGVPDSPEAYFQEIGRAGRDGLPSACTMVLVQGMDVKLREYLLTREGVDGAAVQALCRRVASLAPHGFGTLQMHEGDDALALLVVSHLQALGCVELLQRTPEGLELRITGAVTLAVVNEIQRRLQEHERHRLERFRRMRSFVYLGERCRRQYLLQYFGESAGSLEVACCSACHPRPLPALAIEEGSAGRRKRSKPATSPRHGAATSPHPQAEALLERLRQWRRARAGAMQVPAYVVFGDKDLAGIAEAAPRTLHELAACRGLGPVKLEQYGAELLAEIAAVLGSASTLAGTPAEEPGKPRVSREEMLVRAAALFAAGRTVAEAAGELERAETTMWGYFLEWLAADRTDAWKQAVRKVITPDDYREIRRELSARQEGGRLKEVFDRLDGRYSYDQIRVARAVMEKAAN